MKARDDKQGPDRGTWVLAAVVGVLLIFCVGLAVRILTHEEPPPPPPEVKVAAAEVEQPEEDEPEPEREPEEVGPCGNEAPFKGWGRLETVFGAKFATYVPDSYDGRPMPLVVAFTDAANLDPPRLEGESSVLDGEEKYSALDWLEDRDVVKAAEDRGMIVALAHGADASAAHGLYRVAKRKLCLDDKRLYAFGVGLGGVSAQQFQCGHQVAAFANLGTRGSTGCSEVTPVPYLLFGYSGKRAKGCRGKVNHVPEVSQRLQRHQCKKQKNVRVGGWTCERWCEDDPFIVCMLPEYAQFQPEMPKGCGATRERYGPMLFDFFEQHQWSPPADED